MTLSGAPAPVRVLDLSVWRPGPYATQLLAEWGADVLKVEPPGGDPMRTFPALFRQHNAGKRSMVLNLHDPDDHRRCRELATGADVVVEGFRPGVVDRLGVGYADIRRDNPAVVYCSISGFGQTGPLSAVPGHDVNYQAWAGTLSPQGEPPPSSPPLPLADLAAGTMAAFSVTAALLRRATAGGGGCFIDLSMADVLATWTGAADAGGDPATRVVPGYGTFATADGSHLALGVVNEDHFWAALCDTLHLAHRRDTPFTRRQADNLALQHEVAEAIRRRPLHPLVDDLLAAGVPAAPVLDRAGMLAVPHFTVRGSVTADRHGAPRTGRAVVPTDGPPAPSAAEPPELDQHRGAGWHPR
jgi:crotonobetainyl-CoA:carnitine CoA-transferase CaiB-like acyl-CoA transferase